MFTKIISALLFLLVKGENMKIIGIIGGMGPAATLDLYSKIVALTPANKDQDHIHVIIDSYAQIEDRTAFIENRGENPLPKLCEAAIRLEKAGADALIMPCNTAHYFVDDILKKVNIPLIHIVEATAKAVKTRHPKAKKIGLLATSGTKKAGVYSKVLMGYGFELIELPENVEKDVMACIYSGVKAGKIQEYAPLFQKSVDETERLGADVLIAGCTEIPLLMPYIKSSKPIVDATLELAKAAVKFATGK